MSEIHFAHCRRCKREHGFRYDDIGCPVNLPGCEEEPMTERKPATPAMPAATPSHRERIERLAFEIARRCSPFGGNGLPKQSELEEMIEKHFPDEQPATQSAAASIQRAEEDVEGEA